MARSTVKVLLAVVLFSGCYTYVPSSLGEATPERDVRLRLGVGEATRLDGFVKSGTRTLEGRILQLDQDSLLLRVESVSELHGMRVETYYQRLQVARGDILDVELKRLDKGRTYLVTGAAVAALTAITVSRISGGPGSETPVPPGGPVEAVVPVFSWRVPFRVLSLLGG